MLSYVIDHCYESRKFLAFRTVIDVILGEQLDVSFQNPHFFFLHMHVYMEYPIKIITDYVIIRHVM